MAICDDITVAGYCLAGYAHYPIALETGPRITSDFEKNACRFCLAASEFRAQRVRRRTRNIINVIRRFDVT